MYQEMSVILGAGSVKAYVASPKKYQVIGIVRFGQEYGLLATDTSGQFFRVNGSQVVALHARTVLQAIAVARETGLQNFRKYNALRSGNHSVTVTVRKQRRHPVHEQHNTHSAP